MKKLMFGLVATIFAGLASPSLAFQSRSDSASSFAAAARRHEPVRVRAGEALNRRGRVSVKLQTASLRQAYKQHRLRAERRLSFGAFKRQVEAQARKKAQQSRRAKVIIIIIITDDGTVIVVVR